MHAPITKFSPKPAEDEHC